MLRLLIIVAIGFMSFNVSADVTCKVVKGQESIEINIFDAFTGKAAQVLRIHPIEDYRRLELNIEVIEFAKSILFYNRSADFNLKIKKDFISDIEGYPYLKGDLTFGEIQTKTKCQVD